MGILNSFSIETAENDRVDITAEEIEIFAKKILSTLEENK